jgi:hypothetical protein
LPNYLKPVETDVVTLPSSPEYTVRMKRKASYGDQLEAQTAMLQVDQSLGGMVTKMEWAAYIRALTVRLIVDWNLSDENGGPLPISASSIDRLNQEDGEFLATEAQTRLRLREKAEEIPFAKPSSDS